MKMTQLNKTSIYILVALLVSALNFSPRAQAADSKFRLAYVKSAQVQVYENPQNTSRVLGTIPKGSKVMTDVSKQQNGFIRATTSQGYSGWVAIPALSFAPASGATASASPPNGNRNQNRGGSGGKKWYVSADPFGIILFAGSSLGGEYRFGEHFSVGPELAYYTQSNTTTTLSAFAFGARASYFFKPAREFRQDWFVSLALNMAPFTANYTPSAADLAVTPGETTGTLSQTAIMARAHLGYLWCFSETFNLAGLIGFRYGGLSSPVNIPASPKVQQIVGTSFSGIAFTGELRLGLIF